jgi:hypothetical protein
VSPVALAAEEYEEYDEIQQSDPIVSTADTSEHASAADIETYRQWAAGFVEDKTYLGESFDAVSARRDADQAILKAEANGETFGSSIPDYFERLAAMRPGDRHVVGWDAAREHGLLPGADVGDDLAELNSFLKHEPA